MFFLKSLFLLAYVLATVSLTLIASWQLLLGHWLWLGPLLVWLPLWLIGLGRYLGFWGAADERESGVMALALIGVGLSLIVGDRAAELWWALGGLFALLFYLYLASQLSFGVREARGEPSGLGSLQFETAEGAAVSAASTGVRLLLFVHSHWNPHSRMAVRELQDYVDGQDQLAPQEVALVFAGAVPGWAASLTSQGYQCWRDREGEACAALGLWLRGGSALLPGPEHALRPALAVIDLQGNAGLWERSMNFRQPPSLVAQAPRLQRLLQQASESPVS